MLCGMVFNKKIADFVTEGEVLAYVHANDEEKGKQAVIDILNAYKITDEKVEKPSHILGVI